MGCAGSHMVEGEIMKKLIAVGLPLGLALTGTAVGLTAPAQAATSSGTSAHASVYLHGTKAMAKFRSLGTGEAHAGWEVEQVKASGTANLLPMFSDQSTHGQELRFTCYPLQNGNWSYLVAYRSSTGKPVLRADRKVEVAHRAVYGPAKKAVDRENVWDYRDNVWATGAGATSKNCAGWLNWFDNLVVTNPRTRLVNSFNECYTEPAVAAYTVEYLATSSTAGLRGDKPRNLSAEPMLDTLGYNYGQVLSGD